MMEFEDIKKLNKGVMFFLIFILLVSSFYILAQELEPEQESIKILVHRMGSLFDERSGITTYTYTESESQMKIGDYDYKNIMPVSNETNAYLKLNNQNEIIEADFTTNEKGGIYVIGNDKINVPPNSRLIFKEGKIEIIFPEDTKNNFQIPSRINTSGAGNLIEINGKNIELVGVETPAVLNEGILHIKDGQIYIPKDEKSIVNSLEIYANGVKRDLFFDGEEHSESKSYISMDTINKKLVVEVSSLLSKEFEDITYEKGEYPLQKINLLEDNVFVSNVEEEDELFFEFLTGSSLQIKNRDELGLVPEVILKMEGRGGIYMDNGFIDIELVNERIVKKRVFFSDKGSVPMEIIFNDMNENNLLGTKEEPQKIIISNCNEFVVASLDANSGEGTGCFSKFSVSNKLYYSNSPVEVFRSKGVEIIGNGKWKNKNLEEIFTKDEIRKLNAVLNFIPKEILATKKIFVYPDDFWIERNPGVGGYAIKNEIHMSKSGLLSGDHTVYHENLHNKHFELKGSDWEKSWLKLDGSFGKDLIKSDNVKGLWKDIHDEPRYGKSRAYGELNKMEDVATFPTYVIESLFTASKSPIWEVINSDSKFYKNKMGKKYETGVMDKKMAEEWADIYLGKLYLSYKQGMITPSQHAEVFSKLSKERQEELKKRELEIYEKINK